eukprot:6121522-Pyramimonas_sp.AAC.1
MSQCWAGSRVAALGARLRGHVALEAPESTMTYLSSLSLSPPGPPACRARSIEVRFAGSAAWAARRSAHWMADAVSPAAPPPPGLMLPRLGAAAELAADSCT